MAGISTAGQNLDAFIYFAEWDILITRYKSLKNNHELLENDYASLEARLKIMDDWNAALNVHLGNPVREIEKERKEKEEYKTMIEEMKLQIQELEVAKQKDEEAFNKIKDKCKILTEILGESQREFAPVKPLHVAEVIIAQGGKEDVNVVDHQVANTMKVEDADNENNVAFDKEVFMAAENQNVNNNLIDADNGNNVAFDKDVSVAAEVQYTNTNVIDADYGNIIVPDNDVIAADAHQNVNNNTLSDTSVTSDESDDTATKAILAYYDSDNDVTGTIGTSDKRDDTDDDDEDTEDDDPQRDVAEGCSNEATSSKERVEDPLSFLKRSRDESQSSAEMGLRRSSRTPTVNKKYKQQ